MSCAERCVANLGCSDITIRYIFVVLYTQKIFFALIIDKSNKMCYNGDIRNTAYQEMHISRKNFQKGLDKYDAA